MQGSVLDIGDTMVTRQTKPWSSCNLKCDFSRREIILGNVSEWLAKDREESKNVLQNRSIISP